MKILFKLFALLLVTMALCSPEQVLAVKAYPHPIEVKQPDGEVITIQLNGDEFFHYTTTVAGNFVVAQNKEGYYTFAEINNSGKMIPGEKIVSNNILKSDNNNFLKANSDEFIKIIKSSAKKKLKTKNVLKATENSKITGEIKGLVILVNFKDEKFASSNNLEAFKNLLNQKGYNANGATGSARDYFMDNSNENFTPVFDVFGPVTLSKNMNYYGENDENGDDMHPGEMIIEACTLAYNAYSINFANYDHDHDGIVDNVFVFYAGYGENDTTGKENTIWPHQSYVEECEIANVGIIDSYACTSELKGNGSMCGIGVFVHEFGHVLGLPDFYDADYEQNGKGPGLGYWSTMDIGNYENGGRTPPNYIAMERCMLDWLTPTTLTPTVSGQYYNIMPITSNQAYTIHISSDEYFIIENRKKGDQWDQYLRGEGMLIYHVDKTTIENKDIEWYGETYTLSADDLWYNMIPNIIGDHQCFDLLRANNNPNMYETMPFPAGQTSITDLTTPNLVAWDGTPSGINITDITRNTESGVVSFKLTKTPDTSIPENEISLPFAFNDENTVYFKNISGNTQVNIYDIKGNIYISRNIYEQDSQIITVPGIYIVKLQTNNEVFTYKVIIN